MALLFQSCLYIIYFKLVRLTRSPEICICSSIRANLGENGAKPQGLLRIWIVLFKWHNCVQGIPLTLLFCYSYRLYGMTYSKCVNLEAALIWGSRESIFSCCGLLQLPGAVLGYTAWWSAYWHSVSCQELPEQYINYTFLCISDSD